MKKNNESGFALSSVVFLLLFVAILAPLLFYVTDREAKWSTRQKHSTVASQLATSGIERGVWKLKESNDHWIYLMSTGTMSGYNYDVDYTDVNDDNGVYRLKISTTSDNDLMLIECTAKDSKANVYKAMRAYVRRTQIVAAIHGRNLINPSSTGGDFTVFWGPIYDTGNLYLNTLDVNQLYPRKYATGSITVVNSTGAYSDRDDSPGAPNSDDTEYFAYSTVPPIVTPDFDFYRASAAAMGTYYSGNQTLTSPVSSSWGVYFFEKDLTLKGANKFVEGILIVMRNLTIQGNNTVPTSPSNAYTVTAPSTAYLEYQKNCPSRKNAVGGAAYGDTVATDEYPGDAGLATSGNFTFGSTAGGACGKLVSIKGFVYVGSNLDGGNTNAQVIHGALALSDTATISSGLFEVFYDPSLEIRTAASKIYIEKWEEIPPTPF